MSWNILEGSHIPRALNKGSPQIDQVRLDFIRKSLHRYQPDIVLLNEALWCQPVSDYHVDYADLLGYEHQCSGLYDGVWGNAILSRSPILFCQPFSIYNRGGLFCEVEIQGIRVQVATYHPHPSRYPDNKARDYLSLVGLADPKKPFVLGGDFNAISPEDHPDPMALAEGFARFSKQPEIDSARFIDAGEVIFPALISNGMRDAVPSQGRYASMPSSMVSEDQSSSMRLDHIWVNNKFSVIGGQVLRNEDTAFASDHYPVLVDLRII